MQCMNFISQVREVFAVSQILVGGRHAIAHAVFRAAVHRYDKLGGDGEDADQRARAGKETLSDPGVRGVLWWRRRATHRSQHQ